MLVILVKRRRLVQSLAPQFVVASICIRHNMHLQKIMGRMRSEPAWLDSHFDSERGPWIKSMISTRLGMLIYQWAPVLSLRSP